MDIRHLREEMQDEMEDAVPEALRVLIANRREKCDLKGAPEILDGDPEWQFAKGSQAPGGAQSTTVGAGVQVRIDSQALARPFRKPT